MIAIEPLDTPADRYIATVVRSYIDLEPDPCDRHALGRRLFQMLSSPGWLLFPLAMKNGRQVSALWQLVWERLSEPDRQALYERRA